MFDWIESTVAEENEEINAGYNKIAEEIDRRLSWEYEYIDAAYIPAKVSVTELKRRFSIQSAGESAAMPYLTASLVKKPMFLEKKKGFKCSRKRNYNSFYYAAPGHR